MLLLPTPVRQTAHGYSPELCKRSMSELFFVRLIWTPPPFPPPPPPPDENSWIGACNIISFMLGRVFLGWTSTNRGLMCLARKYIMQCCRWASNTQHFDIKSLYHVATALLILLRLTLNKCCHVNGLSEIKFTWFDWLRTWIHYIFWANHRE